ncbi:fructose-6-phosphate aldolase [Chlamydia trachomatis]|nr:fructose-6-phosphate aldolase [Chlamydia trachomatis]
MEADVLAASFKNSEQVLELVRQGVGAITAAPEVLAALIKNPATDAAIAEQNKHFSLLVGEKRTWKDLIDTK